jgi:ABC-2 type transport system ATP-binding protein
MNDNKAIQAQDLYKDFGEVYAVRGIAFDAYRGEILSLLGPNGAGKSTTISMPISRGRPLPQIERRASSCTRIRP